MLDKSWENLWKLSFLFGKDIINWDRKGRAINFILNIFFTKKNNTNKCYIFVFVNWQNWRNSFPNFSNWKKLVNYSKNFLFWHEILLFEESFRWKWVFSFTIQIHFKASVRQECSLAVSSWPSLIMHLVFRNKKNLK